MRSAPQSEIAVKRIALAPSTQKINMNVHNNAPTTIPDLPSAPIVFTSPDQASSKMSQSLTMDVERLPYPFMPGFVDRKTGNRFTKRVVFDHSDYDDLLGKIIDQIHEKRDRELVEKLNSREDEQNLLEY